MKKLRLSCELAYVLAQILIALAVAMTSAADLGVSMVVAPAYLLSLRLPLSFGQAEAVVQGLLFVLFCLWMGRGRLRYLVSFGTCLFYGAVLDLWRSAVPWLRAGAALTQGQRAVLLLLGMVLTAFSVALSFRAYVYPQVYDFFVQGLCLRRGYSQARFKTLFDAACLALALALSLLFFGRIEGVGWGTVLMTACNGMLLGFFSGLLDRYAEFFPRFPRLAAMFALEEK